jgi:hypothetical protein
MAEATFVLYAPRSRRAGLRATLGAVGADRVTWRERKMLFGSEFYLTGPSAAARRVHAAATDWLHEAPWAI